jgi:sugar (pentulose or hexulose) kinase
MADEWGEIYNIATLTDFVGGFIRDLSPTNRAATQRIAITGVGESGGLVRPDLSLASPMILWHDHRGADYIAPLDDDAKTLVYRVTGLPVNANYGLSKTAWALSNATGETAGAKWLNISEYLAALMTGQLWSEYSLASRTMALDLRLGTWSTEVSALVGIDTDVYPELRAATEGASIAAGFANSVGLPHNVHVHVAGHDHMVGGVGADLQRGELLNSTGTTEGLLFFRDSPTVDDFTAQSKLANGISTTGSEFTLFASIPTGGSAFATLQSMLDMTADELTACIDDVYDRYMAGDIHLHDVPLVLPQFRGSPPPTKRAAARAIISGLGTDATAADIVFGTFLGMALQFSDVLELFRERPDRIKVIGPANRNPLWLQLKADLIGTPLSVSGFPEVVSRGAQSLASGLPGNWDDCSPVDVLVDPARPERLREWHDEGRPRWEHLKAMPA